MKLAILGAALVLIGCAARTSETSVNDASYDKVIKGALGFEFGAIDTHALRSKGFDEVATPRYYSDVGKWTSNASYRDDFFNAGVDLVVSPDSKLLLSVEGLRFYGSMQHMDHFASCMDDYRAIITQLLSKYPTLVSGNLDYSVPNEYATSWYHEGVVQSRYSKQYVGKFIVVTCAIQTWQQSAVIGSLLTVSYHEESAVRERASKEQKAIFEDRSGETLERRGLGTDRL